MSSNIDERDPPDPIEGVPWLVHVATEGGVTIVSAHHPNAPSMILNPNTGLWSELLL